MTLTLQYHYTEENITRLSGITQTRLTRNQELFPGELVTTLYKVIQIGEPKNTKKSTIQRFASLVFPSLPGIQPRQRAWLLVGIQQVPRNINLTDDVTFKGQFNLIAKTHTYFVFENEFKLFQDFDHIIQIRVLLTILTRIHNFGHIPTVSPYAILVDRTDRTAFLILVIFNLSLGSVNTQDKNASDILFLQKQNPVRSRLS